MFRYIQKMYYYSGHILSEILLLLLILDYNRWVNTNFSGGVQYGYTQFSFVLFMGTLT